MARRGNKALNFIKYLIRNNALIRFVLNNFYSTLLIDNSVIVQSKTGQQSGYCWFHNPIFRDKDD
tara:strand:- start:353 stop:547 length:195 start_codon:yes stop_codon:yes gene_type:complete